MRYLCLALAACSGLAQPSAGNGVGPQSSPPVTFQLGAAISGFQTEMGCAGCADTHSDWYQWITTPRIVHNPLLFMSGEAPDAGPGFYQRYESNLDLAVTMQLNAFRFSFEWSRLFPTAEDAPDAEAVAYYHRLLAAMHVRGLHPNATVNHYTLPLWVHDGNACNRNLDACVAAGKGGWADPDRTRIVGALTRYAEFLGREFGDEVDQWATLNEPFTAVVIPSYLIATPMRSNPPGLTGPWMRVDAAKTATLAMIEAHAAIYDALKRTDPVADVGIVYGFTDIQPASSSDKDVRAARDADYFFHELFMQGVARGLVDEKWDGNLVERADLKDRLDWVGINYYYRFTARDVVLPIFAWVSPYLSFNLLEPFDGDAPEGIARVIERVSFYDRPLYITETGTRQEDEARGADWLKRAYASTKGSRRDVRGFYVWSLIDNYEWNSGTSWHFGLARVDPVTKARSLRPAARVLGP